MIEIFANFHAIKKAKRYRYDRIKRMYAEGQIVDIHRIDAQGAVQHQGFMIISELSISSRACEKNEAISQ